MKSNKVMKQYIDKAAVVAEIERIRKVQPTDEFQPKEQNKIDWLAGKEFVIITLQVFLDTIEAKEVDFDREIRRYRMNNPIIGHREESLYDYMANVAKHFFELGIKVRIDKELVDEVYSHIDSIKDTADRMTSGNFMHNRAAIKFSVNTIAKVLELIGLKALKGE